jgi:hypothetical protein
MIDFRYHVVSIVAVFLALALGLFLGSTTLQSTVTNNLNHQAQNVRNDNKRLEATNRTLGGQLSDQQHFTAALEPGTVAGQLSGETVTVVSAPGVDSKARGALENTLQLAGADIGADVSLSTSYLDPTQQAELGQLAGEFAHTSGSSANSGVVQADQLLARVLGDRSGSAAASPSRVNAVLSAFSDGNLLSVANSPARPGTLAVVLTPPVASDATTQAVEYQATALLTLAKDLDERTSGAVVAGPSEAPGTPSDVLDAATGADKSLVSGVSTVASLDRGDDGAAGRIATVLALAQQRNGVTGRFGLGQSTPLPSAANR